MSLAARSDGIWLFLQSTAIVTCSYFMAVMCSAPWQPVFCPQATEIIVLHKYNVWHPGL